jgi:hypothetical protein
MATSNPTRIYTSLTDAAAIARRNCIPRILQRRFLHCAIPYHAGWLRISASFSYYKKGRLQDLRKSQGNSGQRSFALITAPYPLTRKICELSPRIMTFQKISTHLGLSRQLGAIRRPPSTATSRQKVVELAGAELMLIQAVAFGTLPRWRSKPQKVVSINYFPARQSNTLEIEPFPTRSVAPVSAHLNTAIQDLRLPPLKFTKSQGSLNRVAVVHAPKSIIYKAS